jgi:hypothetical protein
MAGVGPWMSLRQRLTELILSKLAHASKRSSGQSSDTMRPTVKTMLTTGPTRRSTVGSSAALGVEDVDPPEAMFAATKAIARPCVACQIRFGAARTNAISAANHGWSRRRGPTRPTLNTQHASGGAAKILISIATPATRSIAIRRPALRLCPQRPDEQPQRHGYDQHVECRRLEQVTDRQRERCHGDGRSRRHLMTPRRAELASKKTAEQHIAASGEHRKDAERPKMAADQRIPASCQRGQRMSGGVVSSFGPGRLAPCRLLVS